MGTSARTGSPAVEAGQTRSTSAEEIAAVAQIFGSASKDDTQSHNECVGPGVSSQIPVGTVHVTQTKLPAIDDSERSIFGKPTKFMPSPFRRRFESIPGRR